MKVYPKPVIYAIKLIFFILISLPHALHAMPEQKLLHPDDWVYEAISILSREQAEIFFTDSRITAAQLQNFLDRIDADSLSQSGLVLYNRLLEYLNSTYFLNFQSGYLTLSADFILQPQLYFKTNKNVPWIYDEHSRSPILTIPFGFSLGPWFTAEMDFYLGENEYAAAIHDNYSNIPLDGGHVDLHTPKRAYISAGIPFTEATGLHFALGLGNNFFGQTQTGSIIVSEYLQRVSYAQLTVYSPFIKYSAEVTQYDVNKYQYMHYFHIRPHRSFSISIAEGIMVNAPLELRFLNPFAIFHSFEAYKSYDSYNENFQYDPNYNETIYEETGCSRVGSYLGIKLEWQPVQYLRVYGLFVMTQFQIPYEKEHWMSRLTPDALGFQAGANLSIPAASGYWDFGLEGVYTYPFLYVLHNLNWSFFKEVHEVDNMTLRYWTGTPFGPDTIAATFKAGFRSSSNWYAGFKFIFSAQGERSGLDIFDWENHSYRPIPEHYNLTVPPTGTPVYTYTVILNGEYNPKKWLSFGIQTGYRVLVNANRERSRIEHNFELSLSVKFKLDRSIWSNN